MGPAGRWVHEGGIAHLSFLLHEVSGYNDIIAVSRAPAGVMLLDKGNTSSNEVMPENIVFLWLGVCHAWILDLIWNPP